MNVKVFSDPIAKWAKGCNLYKDHHYNKVGLVAKDYKRPGGDQKTSSSKGFLKTFVANPQDSWGYHNIPQDAFSHLEKDEHLRDAITSFRATYTKKAKVAWDPTLCKHESNKITCADGAWVVNNQNKTSSFILDSKVLNY
jgi:hypothetical protein